MAEGRGGSFTSTLTPSHGKFRERSKEILFIDTRNLGHLINRRTKELSNRSVDPADNEIGKITATYYSWRNIGGEYEDVSGFCAAVPISRVAELDYLLTPGRYVGLPDEDDDFNFVERFTALKAELEEQLKAEIRLNKAIADNLAKIKI